MYPTLYNTYKWSITFKKGESLCYTPVTYIIVYISYTSTEKERYECLWTRVIATVTF